MGSIEAFDARCTQCFLPEERDRLLGTIEASIGNLDDFSNIVRQILLKASTGTGSTQPSGRLAPSKATTGTGSTQSSGSLALSKSSKVAQNFGEGTHGEQPDNDDEPCSPDGGKQLPLELSGVMLSLERLAHWS